MKNILFCGLLCIGSLAANAQTTATNFTCNDCAATYHDLFAELNAGKVIVITWVMPCGSCIAPALTAATAVQSFSSSNPGQVKHYVVDDYADNSCATLDGWIATNGIYKDASFSDASIDMNDYGGPGMPKVVVLGGASHTIFYNQNGTVNLTDIQNAITAALATGISSPSVTETDFFLYPNPAHTQVTLQWNQHSPEPLHITLTDVSGNVVYQQSVLPVTGNTASLPIDISHLSQGYYQMILSSGNIILHRPIVIAR